MPNIKMRSLWIALGVLLVSGLLAIRVSSKLRMGLTIVWEKGTGSIPDVGWTDLFTMIRSGEHFNLPALAAAPNPYAAIRNPYVTAADLAAGKEAFRSHCESCHGSDGLGGPGGPSLRHRQMTHGSSDWALFRTISLGVRGTAMPASNLPWLDRWRLSAYVKSLMLRQDLPGDSASESKVIDLAPVAYGDIPSKGPASGHWLTYSGSYNGHRFSTLNQITSANAGSLRLLWMRQYDTLEPAIETTPLVIGDSMFVTIPPNRVEALSAKTGSLIWSYERQLPDRLSLCCGFVNRGLAVLGHTLFLGTLDAHLVALDFNTGAVQWDVQIADYKQGYSITGAPLVFKNLVVTGVAGGEFGIRGFIQARDAATGKEVWKFDTVPQAGQPGSETWSGNSRQTGGCSTWITGSFDPETNLLYWPVGNPSPNFEGQVREGENLYSNSVVALNADNGALKWHFQFTPHDVFDWDATEILVLFDQDVKGKRQRFLAQANRNGFYYLLDRESGHFLLAKPFSRQTWAKGIDRTGRPQIDPSSLPTERGTLVYPGVGGAANWESPSYSPQTGLIYVPSLDWGGIFYKGHSKYQAGDLFLGGSWEYSNASNPQGAIRALDALTGEQKWEFRNPAFHVGGLLSTSGQVLFGSQQFTFYVLDARTGKQLWLVNTSSRIVAAPITFLSDGKQVVTIAAGHDILTFGL